MDTEGSLARRDLYRCFRSGCNGVVELDLTRSGGFRNAHFLAGIGLDCIEPVVVRWSDPRT